VETSSDLYGANGRTIFSVSHWWTTKKLYSGRLWDDISCSRLTSHWAQWVVTVRRWAVGLSTFAPVRRRENISEPFARALTGSWSSFPHPRQTSRLSLNSRSTDNKKSFRGFADFPLSQFRMFRVPIDRLNYFSTSCREIPSIRTS